jgi:hypothetical protein
MVTMMARTEPQPAQFNGVKIFSATMFAQRGTLGDSVTEWIASHSELEVVDMVVTQSSDARFHCIAITIFYWEPSL